MSPRIERRARGHQREEYWRFTAWFIIEVEAREVCFRRVAEGENAVRAATNIYE